jgi:hypothetical protein
MFYNPMNVARKLQTPSLMPLYVANGMDITGQMLSYLNSQYRGPRATAGAPASSPGSKTGSTPPAGTGTTGSH